MVDNLLEGSWDLIYIYIYRVDSQNEGPQYRPQIIILLSRGSPKRVPLILGDPHTYMYIYIYI